MAPVTTNGGTRQLPRRDERRAQLVRVAAAAFSDGGFAATSMDDVAKAAGITRLVVYRRFESKHELYREVLDEVATRLAAEWIRCTDGEHSDGAAVRTVLSVARENPDAFRLLFVHAQREPEFRDFYAEFRELQIEVSDRIIGGRIADPVLRRWANDVLVDHLVSSVLRWLSCDCPSRDDEFVAIATASLAASYREIRRKAPSH